MDDRFHETRLDRRTALRGALAGAAGLALLGRGAGAAFAAPPEAAPPAPRARAKAVVEIWMAGGPSHLDTFDPKPEAGSEYCGPLRTPVATNADGVRIGELLPLLAKQADKYSLVRSMTHGIDSHETAAYTVQTGATAGAERLVYPSFAAVVASLKGYDHGYRGRIPPFVMLTTPRARFSEVGFLGLRHKPFVTGGDPRQERFAVEGIVAEELTDRRQVARRGLLHALDTLGRAIPGDASFAQLDRCEKNAYDLILGDAGKVFDLRTEKDEMRERYGRTTFGQSCLAARRLVEEGVPYVTLHTGGWDTHKRNFETLRFRLGEFDRGVAALLADLSERGLLESTIVWCCGEFGRTPRIQWEEPWSGGRGHHGRCFSALVAGGGFRGGSVVGASDARGETVADRPVRPQDLHATMHRLLGIDPDAPLPNPAGLDVRVMPPPDAKIPRAPLEEIT